MFLSDLGSNPYESRDYDCHGHHWIMLKGIIWNTTSVVHIASIGIKHGLVLCLRDSLNLIGYWVQAYILLLWKCDEAI